MKEASKWTRQQSFFFGAAALLLIAGIALIAQFAQVWPQGKTIAIAVLIGSIDIALWVMFLKRTVITNRHEGGGSSVK